MFDKLSMTIEIMDTIENINIARVCFTDKFHKLKISLKTHFEIYNYLYYLLVINKFVKLNGGY